MRDLRRWFDWYGKQASKPQTTDRLVANRRLGLELLEDRRLLATLTVTSLADTIADDGALTLREAIYAAEATSGVDTIQFAASLAGVIHLSNVGDESAGASALLVSTPIVVRGNAHGITIARSVVAPEMRFFHVTAAGNLTIESLTLTSGITRGANGEVGQPNGHDGRGGAILNMGKLTVVASTMYGNLARGGASALGGIAGAGRGGAIYSDGGFVDIRNSTFSGNAATNSDGTTANSAYGGGIFARNSALTINYSTIVDNSAAAGRGVYVLGDGIGKSATLELNNSIVGNNGPTDEATDLVVTHDHGGAVASSGASNLVRREVSFNGSIASHAAPMLGPLADNGGPTWTHAILPGSPALDGGSVATFPGEQGVPLTDQRGAGSSRIVDGDGLLGAQIDIGAYELQSSSSIVELPGDYNQSGTVDAADYTAWRDQLNQTVAPFSGADGDGSGTVDIADYSLWKANYGRSTSGVATSVVATMSLPLQKRSMSEAGDDAIDQADAALQDRLGGSRWYAISPNLQRHVPQPVQITADASLDSNLLNALALLSDAEQTWINQLAIDLHAQGADSSQPNGDVATNLSVIWDDWQPVGFLATL